MVSLLIYTPPPSPPAYLVKPVPMRIVSIKTFQTRSRSNGPVAGILPGSIKEMSLPGPDFVPTLETVRILAHILRYFDSFGTHPNHRILRCGPPGRHGTWYDMLRRTGPLVQSTELRKRSTLVSTWSRPACASGKWVQVQYNNPHRIRPRTRAVLFFRGNSHRDV